MRNGSKVCFPRNFRGMQRNSSKSSARLENGGAREKWRSEGEEDDRNEVHKKNRKRRVVNMERQTSSQKEKSKKILREQPKPKYALLLSSFPFSLKLLARPFLPSPLSGARTLLDFHPTEVRTLWGREKREKLEGEKEMELEEGEK